MVYFGITWVHLQLFPPRHHATPKTKNLSIGAAVQLSRFQLRSTRE